MDNNDVLRRVRYIFDINDSKMIELFGLANHKVKRSEVSDWLKREDEPTYQKMSDNKLALFLNGLIIDKRGQKDDSQLIAEQQINNNIVFRKLKIALNLKTDEILDLFKSIKKSISAHELSAFLRNPKQGKYRPCNDQYLRNFLNSLLEKYRPE